MHKIMRILALILIVAVPGFAQAQRIFIPPVVLAPAEKQAVRVVSITAVPAPYLQTVPLAAGAAPSLDVIELTAARATHIDTVHPRKAKAEHLAAVHPHFAPAVPALIVNANALAAVAAYRRIDPRYPDIEPLTYYGQRVEKIKLRVSAAGWTPALLAEWEKLYADAGVALRAYIESEKENP